MRGVEDVVDNALDVVNDGTEDRTEYRHVVDYAKLSVSNVKRFQVRKSKAYRSS